MILCLKSVSSVKVA